MKLINPETGIALATKIKKKIDAEKRLDQFFKDSANCNEKTPLE